MNSLTATIEGQKESIDELTKQLVALNENMVIIGERNATLTGELKENTQVIRSLESKIGALAR